MESRLRDNVDMPPHSGHLTGLAVDQQPGAGGQGLVGIDVIRNLIDPGGLHGELGVVWTDTDVLGLHLVIRQRHQAIHRDRGCAGVSGIGKVDDNGAGGAGRTGGSRRTIRADQIWSGRTFWPCRTGGTGGTRRTGGYNRLYTTVQTAFPPVMQSSLWLFSTYSAMRRY